MRVHDLLTNLVFVRYFYILGSFDLFSFFSTYFFFNQHFSIKSNIKNKKINKIIFYQKQTNEIS